MKKRVVYYTDPLNDDFSGVGERHKVEIGGNYPYIRKNIFYKIAAFIVYRVFVTPFAYFFCKLKFRIKIEGRDKLKPFKKDGFYMYGNHTQIPGDGFIPNIITFPQKTHIIVSPDNVALRGTRTLMMMLGAMPTPTNLKGFGAFEKAIAPRSTHLAVLHGNKTVCFHIFPLPCQGRKSGFRFHRDIPLIKKRKTENSRLYRRTFLQRRGKRKSKRKRPAQ